MKAKYFNKLEFNQAFSLVETNPYEAKNKYEEYLKKYPKDYSAYAYYAKALIAIKEFEEAKKILDYVESLYKRDSRFTCDLDKTKHLERNILANRIKILSYCGKFDELYQLYLNNYLEIEQMDLGHIIFYCMKQIGKLPSNSREPNSYLFRQIIEYQESDFLFHIQKHLSSNNQESNNSDRSVFSQDFPISEIIEEVKKHLPISKRLCYGYYSNVCIFRYDNCGRNENRIVDYFKVICFNDTENIITMFPANDCENLPYIDLNYLTHNKENSKIKRLSQIEKFNQRYKHF